MSELNKVFDAPTREARRKILDNYPISADDKNKFLNKVSKGGETSNWRYFDLSKIMSTGGLVALGVTATLIKFYDNDKNKFFIAPAGVAMGMESIGFSDMSVAIDFNLVISFIYMHNEYQTITAQEMLDNFGIAESEITVGEITKEEFYTLE